MQSVTVRHDWPPHSIIIHYIRNGCNLYSTKNIYFAQNDAQMLNMCNYMVKFGITINGPDQNWTKKYLRTVMCAHTAVMCLYCHSVYNRNSISILNRFLFNYFVIQIEVTKLKVCQMDVFHLKSYNSNIINVNVSLYVTLSRENFSINYHATLYIYF